MLQFLFLFSLEEKIVDIEERTETLQNNFNGIEKSISDVLKTLESSCETWTSCLNLLQNLNEKQILLAFDPPIDEENNENENCPENKTENDNKINIFDEKSDKFDSDIEITFEEKNQDKIDDGQDSVSINN